MSYRWISWYHSIETMGEFELHSPWWVSGYAMNEGEIEAETIVAAMPGELSEAEAEAFIKLAYDKKPKAIEFRFNNVKDGDDPFSERFPRAKWMKWPPLIGKEYYRGSIADCNAELLKILEGTIRWAIREK